MVIEMITAKLKMVFFILSSFMPKRRLSITSEFAIDAPNQASRNMPLKSEILSGFRKGALSSFIKKISKCLSFRQSPRLSKANLNLIFARVFTITISDWDRSFCIRLL